jgi:hypothetical protein
MADEYEKSELDFSMQGITHAMSVLTDDYTKPTVHWSEEDGYYLKTTVKVPIRPIWYWIKRAVIRIAEGED